MKNPKNLKKKMRSDASKKKGGGTSKVCMEVKNLNQVKKKSGFGMRDIVDLVRNKGGFNTAPFGCLDELKMYAGVILSI
jgi:hypothetical protein